MNKLYHKLFSMEKYPGLPQKMIKENPGISEVDKFMINVNNQKLPGIYWIVLVGLLIYIIVSNIL